VKIKILIKVIKCGSERPKKAVEDAAKALEIGKYAKI
jgi:hypothetical protein